MFCTVVRVSNYRNQIISANAELYLIAFQNEIYQFITSCRYIRMFNWIGEQAEDMSNQINLKTVKPSHGE